MSCANAERVPPPWKYRLNVNKRLDLFLLLLTVLWAGFFSVFTSQTFSLVCEGATSTSNVIFVYIVFVSLLTSVVCGYFFSCLQIQVCF